MNELNEDFEKLMELYNSVKREIRQRDKHLYERWKAGGFCIDSDILSMYPSLPEVMESLQAECPGHDTDCEIDPDNPCDACNAAARLNCTK